MSKEYDMTDVEITEFVNLYTGGVKKDLRRHRIAVIRVWFNLWPSKIWLSKKDLPMLYGWIERLENILHK